MVLSAVELSSVVGEGGTEVCTLGKLVGVLFSSTLVNGVTTDELGSVVDVCEKSSVLGRSRTVVVVVIVEITLYITTGGGLATAILRASKTSDKVRAFMAKRSVVEIQ